MQKLFSAVLVALMALAGGALAQTFSLKHTLPNPTPEPDDQFGTAVAVVGNNVLVGAPHDNVGGFHAGAAYLFDGNTGALLQTFMKTNQQAGDLFGSSVAGVGNNVLIGAPGVNGSSGEAYLFDSGGNLLQTFSNPNTSSNADQFGSAVAGVGSKALIGAPSFSSNAGAAYLFDGATVTTLSNPSPAAGDKFGFAVAGVGSNVLIGAPGANGSSGEAYLFDTSGILLKTFTNPNTISNTDQFGFSVAGTNNYVLIGAPFRNNMSLFFSGAAYLFNATTPFAAGPSISDPSPAVLDQFGSSVAAFDNNVLIGAPGANVAAGEAHLYGATGALLQTFPNPTPADDEAFGRAVAAAGNNIVVGAFREGTTPDDLGPGAVYHFSSNAPPVADAGDDQTVECTSPSGTLVTLDGSGSTDADGDQLTYTWRESGNIIAGPTTSATSQVSLSLGSHTIELTVDDGNGGTDTDEVIKNVVDTTPPVITLQPPIALWPPNHKYTTISVAQIVVSVNDACAGSIPVSAVKISSVSSDEPDDAPDFICLIDDPLHVCYNGDGSTANDVVIAGDCNSVQLRQERAASGNGRVYTINLQVSDGTNVATVPFKVSVPHDQNGGAAEDDVPCYTVASNCGMAKAAGNSGEDDVDIAAPALPKGYALSQNYPNPFNPTTGIRFTLPEAGRITLKIFSMLGENIRTLVEGEFAAGVYALQWNAQNDRGEKVPSGVYFYQLVTPNFTETKRMILAK